MVNKTDIGRSEEKHGSFEARVLLHPLVIVVLSFLIAIAAFASDFDAVVLSGDGTSIAKLVGGALFLVLVALFFQQRTQVRQNHHERERHFAEASDELRRMKAALRRSAAPRD